MRKVVFSESQKKMIVTEKQAVAGGTYETAVELTKVIQYIIGKIAQNKKYSNYIQGTKVRWSYSDYIKIVIDNDIEANAYVNPDDYQYDGKRNRVRYITIGINPNALKFDANGIRQTYETLAHELSHAYDFIKAMTKNKGNGEAVTKSTMSLDNSNLNVTKLLYLLNPEEDRAVISSLFASLKAENVGRNEVYQFAFNPNETDFGFKIYALSYMKNKIANDNNIVRDIIFFYLQEKWTGNSTPLPAFRKRFNNGNTIEKYKRRIIQMIDKRINRLKAKGNQVIGNYVMQKYV